MAIVRPFKAIRPGKKYADKVIALPYDVMNRAEATEMAKNNPYSFLHISRSEIDLPQVKNPYSKEVYQKAKNNIDEFIKKDILFQDSQPSMYIYRQKMKGNVQTGLVACVSIDEYVDNTIKKHEFTRVEKEKDRINHFDVCDTNTEPVFLTYKTDTALKDIIKNYTNDQASEYDLTTDDGVSHTLWKIDDAEVLSQISDIFSRIKSLYIADGHHRSASACKVGLKRREENPNYTGDEEFNFFMAAIFPDEELKVFDYNRVVKDLNGLSKAQLFKDIEESGFSIEEATKSPYRPLEKHTFGMFIDNKWYKLTANQKIIPDHIINSLDVAILQNSLLEPILGISDPRTDNRIDFVGGIRGLEELEKRVNDDMEIAFAVYPVTIGDLMEVSDNDMVMPPKSTWFEPKLGSGLFMHKL